MDLSWVCALRAYEVVGPTVRSISVAKKNELKQVSGRMNTFWTMLADAMENEDPKGWEKAFGLMANDSNPHIKDVYQRIARMIVCQKNLSARRIDALKGCIASYCLEKGGIHIQLAQLLAWMIDQSDSLGQDVFVTWKELDIDFPRPTEFQRALKDEGYDFLGNIAAVADVSLWVTNALSDSRTDVPHISLKVLGDEYSMHRTYDEMDTKTMVAVKAIKLPQLVMKCRPWS